MADPFEDLLKQPAKPSAPTAKPVDAFEALLSGSVPAPAPSPSPAAPSKPGAASSFIDDQISGTADAIDLVWDLVTAPAVAATEVGTRAYHGTRNLAGASNLSRREISVDAQKNASAVGDYLGSPVRKTLQKLGILAEGDGLVGKAMSKAMRVAEQAATNLEANTSGAILKEDTLMGINMLFGALGVKGLKYTATTAAERGRAKAALQELSKLQEVGNARNAASDAAAFAAEEAHRAAGGIPKRELPRDNPVRREAARFDAQANAEQQAYDLMQSGAPKAKVESIIKRNPAVGLEMDKITERRARAAAFLEEVPEAPIREDGTFAPNSLSAMLRRPSEMGPKELAARDAAAGISRGPLGEPIFSADPQPRAPSRSVRDPRRPQTANSGLMGVQPKPEADFLGAAASGGRSVADPRRTPTGDSGLSGTQVRRDALGTPISGPQALAVVGATGLGLAALYSDADKGDLATAAMGGALLLGKGRGISLEAIRALPDTATLREIRDASAYTLNTLENLPGNRAVHSKQAIGELLRRQEVTKAERDILQSVLDATPGDTITSKQLMAGVKEATGDFELKPEASGQYADYGLENIDRAIAPDNYGNQSLAEMRAEYEQNAAQLRDEGPMLRERAAADPSVRFPDFPYGNRQAAEMLRTLETRQRELPGEIAIAEKMEGAMESPTTTIYQSPFELGTNNHFGDPKYFAHTRSFYENGVKHVVEMQSDLAQKAGKVLTPEERANLMRRKAWADRISLLAEEAHAAANDVRSTNEDVVARANAYFAGLEDAGLDRKLTMGQHLWNNYELGPLRDKIEIADPGGRSGHMGNYDIVVDMLIKEVQDAGPEMSRATQALESGLWSEARTYNLMRRELETKLAASGPLERVSPMLKRWDRRLVREELAASARGRENPERTELRDMIKNRMRNMPEEARTTNPELLEMGERLMEMPERLLPEPVVRFATADTVAKVEGWPEVTTYKEGATAFDPELQRQMIVGNFKDETGQKHFGEFRLTGNLKVKGGTVFSERQKKGEAPVWGEHRPSSRDVLPAELGQRRGLAPEHQGIYDRYNKEVTSFLKQLGGKEVTDSVGHTWIEVPTEGSKRVPAGRRVQQFGFADPKLLTAITAIGGGAQLAYLLSDKENQVRNAGIAATVASLGLFALSRARGIGEYARGAGATAEKYLGMVSTRVGNMSPVLLRRMRDHEMGVLMRTNENLKAVAPFVEGLRKLPERTRDRLDAVILTGNAQAIISALGATGNPALVAEFRKVRSLLDRTGGELMQAGKLKGLLADYFPRVVTDVEGLLGALGAEQRTYVEKLLKQAADRTQKAAMRDLTPLEVSQIINQAMKSQGSGQGRPGFLKKRVIGEVTPELAKFYAPASESLVLYVRAVSKELERAKFFGENLVRDKDTGAANLDESIGNLIREEKQAGRITSADEMELRDILRSRFGPGEQSTSRGLQAAKNIAYAGLLGHVTSALTQSGDLLIAAAAHGIMPTVKALQQVATNDKARFTVHDLGLIDHMAEEVVGGQRTPVTVFGRQVQTAKFVEHAFRWSGFSFIDTVGKNVSIQAAYNKLQRQANSATGIKALEAKYGKAYAGAEFPQLVADLRSGVLTDGVRSALFSELSDLQPISKLEVPQGYLDNPNGRTLYMLKTFMLKQADVVRRNVVQEYRRGNKAKATEMALRFGLALGIGGAGTQMINDFLMGKDTTPEFSDVPMNILKTFALSKYTLDKLRKEGPLAAGVEGALPPYRMYDAILRADPKAIQYLPVVGKLLYAHDPLEWQVESGSERFNRLEKARKRREAKED